MPGPAHGDARDLRSLTWSSIDNDESMDLDQIEVAEKLADGSIRILVGIADVDALVVKGSAIDEHAHTNATSLYPGLHVYPMLPERLSTDLTSLAEHEDRLAIVIEVVVDASGDEVRHDIYRATVCNQAKLAYDGVGAWLDGAAAPPAKVAANTMIAAQLRLQHDAAQRLKGQRERSGALEFDTIEATPVARDGKIVDLTLARRGKARDLIEDFMIAANIAMAKFLEEHGASGIRRVVREPERWSRIVALAATYGVPLPSAPDPVALSRFLAKRRAADPDRFPDLSISIVKLIGPGEYALDQPGKDPGGHFGLAVHDYTHATAPNRRYADLVTQRLVKAVLAAQPAPYSDAELVAIAAHCTEREDAARKVERTMRKVVAAQLLSKRIGQNFPGIVTGVTPGGIYARTFTPPAEGRIMQGEQGLDVGDHVRLRLLHTNPERGFIDFAASRAPLTESASAPRPGR